MNKQDKIRSEEHWRKAILSCQIENKLTMMESIVTIVEQYGLDYRYIKNILDESMIEELEYDAKMLNFLN